MSSNTTTGIDIMLLAATNTTLATNQSNDDYGEGDVPLLVTNEAEPAARVLPRITAFISLLGVACVTIEASLDLWAQNQRRRRSSGNSTLGGVGHGNSTTSATRQVNTNTVNHIQLCYQMALLCYLLALVLGSTPAPSDQYIWGAVGNQATCTMQAALFQFGMYATIGWDAALSTTYWRMVTGARTVGRPWLIFWHLLIWPICLASAIYPLTTDLYNFNYNICWIHEYPNNCHLDEHQDCIRGEDSIFWTNLASAVAVLHLLYSIIVMIGLYCSIRKLEVEANQRRRSQQSTAFTVATTKTSASVQQTRQYSRKIAIQGLFYASGMIITMLPTAITVLLFNTTGYWSVGLAVFAVTMTPLVGYLNFLIYMRNRSVDQCHTRYAKALRRLHGYLLLDRDCWNWCCRCCICHFPQVNLAISRGASRSSKKRTSEPLQDMIVPAKGHQNNNNNKNKPPRAISQLTCSMDGFTQTPQHSNNYLDIEDDDICAPPIDLDDPRQPGILLQEEFPACPPPEEHTHSTSNLNDSFTEEERIGEDPLFQPTPPPHEEEQQQEQPFKTWVSESSEFETWRSQASDATSTVFSTSRSNFKVWTSETSEFETWKSQASSDATSTIGISRSNDDLEKKTTSFKVWTSETSEFETWKSQASSDATSTIGISRSNDDDEKKTTPFKVWTSETGEFETWKSQATTSDSELLVESGLVVEEEDVVVPTGASTTTNANTTNANNNFKTWKSPISEFETWQTEIDDEEDVVVPTRTTTPPTPSNKTATVGTKTSADLQDMEISHQ